MFAMPSGALFLNPNGFPNRQKMDAPKSEIALRGALPWMVESIGPLSLNPSPLGGAREEGDGALRVVGAVQVALGAASLPQIVPRKVASDLPLPSEGRGIEGEGSVTFRFLGWWTHFSQQRSPGSTRIIF